MINRPIPESIKISFNLPVKKINNTFIINIKTILLLLLSYNIQLIILNINIFSYNCIKCNIEDG